MNDVISAATPRRLIAAVLAGCAILTSAHAEDAVSTEAIPEFQKTTDQRGGYDWWSLQPLSDAQPPAVQSADGWGSHPVDRFVYRKLVEQGLRPSLPADPRVLIRRATYDLTGLPPTPDDVAAFRAACEAESGSPDRVGDGAYEALIDRLLAAPQYGERWGRHWLDVVRFGESTGYEVNHIIDDMWPFRDYVIKSFNDDKPYDLMVREHLAGDAIAPGDPSVEVAMTFLVAGPHDIVGNQDPVQAAQIRANGIDEIVRATSESFLGLTVGCARCHDHKFDAISQRDYHGMYTTFAGVFHDSRTVATDEQRAAYEGQVAPLRAERDRLATSRKELESGIMARAESNIAEFEARWTRPPVDRKGTEEIFPPIAARYLRLRAEGRDNDPNSRTNFRLDEFEVWTADDVPRNVAAAANGGKATGQSHVAEDFGEAYLADLTIDGKFGARWIANGPELLIEFAETESVRRVFISSDRMGALSPTHGEAPTVSEYRIEVSTDGEHWTQVADSYSRKPVSDAHRNKRMLDWTITTEEREQRAALDQEIAAVDARIREVPPLPRLRVGRLVEPEGDYHIFLGGDPQRKGDVVVPSAIDTLADALEAYRLTNETPERDRRKAFADWIVAPENPLTPRVLANRVWYYHFGKGIAANPSDVGFMGGTASHPELLDWLAHELVMPSDGSEPWRLKRMHKLLMLSQTYRQSGEYRAEPAAGDADNRFLWRFSPRRLSAEEVRDTVLAISGKLDMTMGGPGFRLYQYMRDNVSTYAPLDTFGPETYRRAVYHQNVRAARVDLMTEFDSPDCALAAPRRATTTTPLQALTLMNHTFTMDMATALSERLRADTGGDVVSAQIERAYALAFSRTPAETERQTAESFIAEYGLVAFCRGLLNANELVYLD